jgi:hypothetical protein
VRCSSCALLRGAKRAFGNDRTKGGWIGNRTHFD